jgi:pantetheine-phosphate adenylyltransferase
MRKAIYPGSFDPITRGHIDIIDRASKLFDKVTIVVMVNPSKVPMFTLEEKINLIKESIKTFKNIEVDFFHGLLVDYAVKTDSSVIIKGLRAVTDFEYEFQMALMNKSICTNVETLFMMTSPNYSFLSSSLVKEVAKFGGNIDNFVTPLVKEHVLKKLNGGS